MQAFAGGLFRIQTRYPRSLQPYPISHQPLAGSKTFVNALTRIQWQAPWN